MLTLENKQKIIAAIKANRANFSGSDAKYATSLGINKGILSRILKGEVEKVLSEGNWIQIARKLGVSFTKEGEWQTANTKVFKYITDQIDFCQENSISAIYCDRADVGKTHAAKHFAKNNKNAVYVDCSLVKTKQKLVRQIAQELGVDYTGKYNDVFQDLVWYLKSIHNPIIILDEAGDLDYPAFLEIKALWNATEGYCGWYMIGADGLQAKIDRAIRGKKVGYTEIFSRFGKKYNAEVPMVATEAQEFLNRECATLIKTNYPHGDFQKILAKCNGSLRRVRTEITKLKRAA